MTRAFLSALGVIASLGLTGCGGGGGSAEAATIPPSPSRGVFASGVAFLADAEADERHELYVADLDGNGSFKVSGPLVAGGDVRFFQWSPDRQLLAFLADKDGDEVVELYVVGAAGGNVTKVSGPLVAGGDVTGFLWAPDSQRLAYLADQEEDGTLELYSASAFGGSVAKLSGPIPSLDFVRDFDWAPDSSRIAYLAKQDDPATLELFTSLAAGGDNVKVSGPQVTGGGVEDLRWAPDSSRVAYIARQDEMFRRELYVSLPAGGGNLKVSGPFLSPLIPEIHGVSTFEWAPDSSRIAYNAARDFENRFEGYSTLPDGTDDKKFFTASADFEILGQFAWAPDSLGIAYRIQRPMIGPETFLVHPLDAPPTPLGQGERVRWAPDASRVASIDIAGVTTTAPGGEVQPVSVVAVGEDVQVFSVAWAPDSSRVAYLTDDLHVSFADTDYGSIRLTNFHDTAHVDRFQWTPDSSRLVFRADATAAQVLELFAIDPDGTELVVLSPPLVFGGQVIAFSVR
jgi:Tol biopolymer transport system component